MLAAYLAIPGPLRWAIIAVLLITAVAVAWRALDPTPRPGRVRSHRRRQP